jgi:Transcriptional regulatory protein, C terminal
MEVDPHVEAWWELAPETFRVVRDATGTVRGFSTLCQTQDVPRALLRSDPVAQACLEHLRGDPVPGGQRVLLNRYSHAAQRGATATLWLDTKRAYLELRPHLRRLYVPAPDVAAALPALAPLGFRRLDLGPHVMLMNDFGPGSVDGWLGDVVGRELQADEGDVIDADGRRLVLDGRVVDLSRLELGVLRHLQLRDGAAVTREELLREVWGHQWTGGSNVVEVVISSVRRKLGDRAGALETLRGVGYRLGPLD